MNNLIDYTPLTQIQYGMFLITTTCNATNNGQITTVVMQVTANPPQLAICLNKANFTHQLIMTSKIFGVSILSTDTDLKFIGRFGFRTGRDYDKLADIKYKKLQSGTPLVIENTVGILDCKVVSSIDLGTHTIFIGMLVATETISNSSPMTYNYYHTVLKGKTERNAPTFQANNTPLNPIQERLKI